MLNFVVTLSKPYCASIFKFIFIFKIFHIYP